MWNLENIHYLLKESKYFCLAPWVHLHVTSIGIMSPCSMSERGPEELGYGDLNVHTFQELWQGESIRRHRVNMMNDVPDSRCVNCIEGRLGEWSFRNEINKYTHCLEKIVNTDSQGYAVDAFPIFWDIRFSNICNLKCRSCNDCSSSSWYDDSISLNKLDKRNIGKRVNGLQDSSKLLTDLNSYFPFVAGLRCAGGEPILMEQNYSILEKLIELKKQDINIEYETNLTILSFKKIDIVNYWKKFPHLIISVSLDGLFEKSEYLRKNLIWDELLSNLLYVIKTCKNAYIRINYTVTVYNIDHLPDFHKYMVENNYIKYDQIQLINAYDPVYYCSRILPKNMKIKISNKIKNHIKWIRNLDANRQRNNIDFFKDKSIEQWIACLNHMNFQDWSHLIPTFREYTKKLDLLRNEDCLTVFPELNELFIDR